jgi:hypothetical protein
MFAVIVKELREALATLPDDTALHAIGVGEDNLLIQLPEDLTEVVGIWTVPDAEVAT